jgi:micrococcal nuclease
MIEATIVRVVDGDTIKVKVDELDVRLDFIDAPETRGEEKELGLKTKEWLQKELKVGDKVMLDVKKEDTYGRQLSVVYKGERNINGELLKKKLAEVYTPEHHNNGIID